MYAPYFVILNVYSFDKSTAGDYASFVLRPVIVAVLRTSKFTGRIFFKKRSKFAYIFSSYTYKYVYAFKVVGLCKFDTFFTCWITYCSSLIYLSLFSKTMGFCVSIHVARTIRIRSLRI